MTSKLRYPGGAKEHIARFVRNGIWSGRWAAGQPLDVSALASELLVSPSPVREALARLRGEEVLQTKHRGGYHVPLLQAHELSAEYAFSALLAGALLARVAGMSNVKQALVLSDDQATYVERRLLALVSIAEIAGMPRAALVLRRSCLRTRSYIAAEASVISEADAMLSEALDLIKRSKFNELASVSKTLLDTFVLNAPELCGLVFEQAKSFEKSLE